LSFLQQSLTILLTSVGNEAIHGFGRDLRRRAPHWQLVGTDMRADAAGFALCDRHHVVPARSDSSYLARIVELCAAEKVDLLLPLSTRDQDYFSSEPVRRALGELPVVVSSAEAIARANTKIALFETVGQACGLLPAGQVVEDPGAAMDALRDLVAEHGAALLKQDDSTGGRGMLRVGRPDSDAAPVSGAEWLSLQGAESVLQQQQESGGGSWPRQAVAWLPGEEFSVDLLCDKGEVLAGVVRLRRASRGGLATDAETVPAPDVLAAASEVARIAELSYVNNVQLRRDAAGQPRLLEVNPRIPGTIGLTVQAGLNLPLAACCQALGESLSLPEPELGLRAFRHGEALYALRRFGSAASAGPPAVRSLLDFIVGDEPVFVLWDLDGTLVRLDVELREIARWKEQLQEQFGALGWSGGWSPLLPSLEGALALAGASLAAAAAEELCAQAYQRLDAWEAAAVRGVEPVTEVAELLTGLTRCEVHMALVSNNGPSAVAQGLACLDAHLNAIGAGTNGLSAVVSRGPEHAAKPAPAMLSEAVRLLERQHGEPSRIVCIGDSPGDLAAARALSAATCVPVDFLSFG